MKSFRFPYLVAGVVVVLAAGGIFYLATAHKTPVQQTGNSQLVPTEAVSEINSAITPSPTPAASKTPPKTIIAVPNGPAGGLISCNYQIPAGPTTYGTAALEAKWNNLKGQAAICVAVNGQSPALMSLQTPVNGSAEISAPWLAPNGNYAFGLYDTNCNGTAISTCQIHTNMPPVVTPRPGRN